MAHVGLKELAYREHDGLEIALLWDAVTNEVAVTVTDVREELCFTLPVPAERALDAFNHPYAYAAADDGAQHSVLV
jgi:hypothetical protein